MRSLARNDHGAHAILLYGARGSGKTELARIITELWICNSPTSDGADGTCRACNALRKGNSPDTLDILPWGRSSIIGVKAITNDRPDADDPPVPLLQFFRTPPLMSRHKVATFHDGHRMNYVAANALLKTLEEPHPHAKILLITDSVGSLLPTIRSRCLLVACEGPEPFVLHEAFPDVTADEIRLSFGAPGRLAHIREHKPVYDRLTQFARKLLDYPPGAALIAAEEFASIAEGFQFTKETTARAANAEALSMLATFFSREPTAPAAWTHEIVEAHRRIIGNGLASIVFDALFTSLGARAPRPHEIDSST